MRYYDMDCSDENFNPLIRAMIKRTRESVLVWKLLYPHENKVFNSYTTEHSYKGMKWTLNCYKTKLEIIYHGNEDIIYDVSDNTTRLVEKLHRTIFDKIKENFVPDYYVGFYGIFDAMNAFEGGYFEGERNGKSEYKNRNSCIR